MKFFLDGKDNNRLACRILVQQRGGVAGGFSIPTAPIFVICFEMRACSIADNPYAAREISRLRQLRNP
jgi:hypothetical protein